MQVTESRLPACRRQSLVPPLKLRRHADGDARPAGRLPWQIKFNLAHCPKFFEEWEDGKIIPVTIKNHRVK